MADRETGSSSRIPRGSGAHDASRAGSGSRNPRATGSSSGNPRATGSSSRNPRSTSSRRYLREQIEGPATGPRKGFPVRVVLVAFAALLVTGVATAAYVITGGAKPAGPIAGLAPARTSLWIQAKGLGDSLEAFEQTQACKDYGRSWTHESFADELAKAEKDGKWIELSVLRELGLPLDEKTARLFLGRDAGIAVLCAKEAAKASFVLLTELDTVGLAKEVATKESWRAIWDKLSGALGEGTRTESFLGYDIASRKATNGEVFVTLVSEVLVLSDDLDAVKEVLSVHAGKAPALLASPAFQEETKRLSPGATAFAYFDLATFRDAERVAKIARGTPDLSEKKDASAPPLTARTFEVLASDLKPLDAVAIGAYVPRGNVYATTFASSRKTEDVFAGMEPRDALSILPDRSMAVFEGKGLHDLVAGAIESPVFPRLAKTDAFRWLHDQVEERGRRAAAGAPAPDVKKDRDLTFESRLFAAAVRASAVPFLPDEVAMGGKLQLEKERPVDPANLLFAFREDAATRVAVDLFTGVAAERAGMPSGKPGPGRGASSFGVSYHGGKRICSFGDATNTFALAQVGSLAVFGNRPEEVAAALDRGSRDSAGADLRASAGRLPPGAQLVLRYDMKEYTAALKEYLAQEQAAQRRAAPRARPADPSDGAEKMIDNVIGQFVDLTLGIYVPKDYASCTVRTFGTCAPKSRLAGIYASVDPEPILSHLPAETMLTEVGGIDPKAFYDWLRATAEDVKGQTWVGVQLEDMKDLLGGNDVRSSLVAPLGSSFGIGVVEQDRLPAAGAPASEELAAIPAVVGVVELKDASTFKKSLTTLARRWLRRRNEETAKEYDDLEAKTGEKVERPPAYELAEHESGGETVYRIVSPDDADTARSLGEGYSPCFAVTDAFLVASTSEPALRRALAARKEGTGLSKAPAFGKLVGRLPESVSTFQHVSFSGIVSQVLRNADLIARNVPVPPAEATGARPTPPLRVPDAQAPRAEVQAYLKASSRYRTDVAAWQKKADDWRRQHAAENAAELKTVLDSCRVLGGFAGTSAFTPEGVGGVLVWKLDLDGPR